MNRPNQGDIKTLEDLLEIISIAPNRKALKSQPMRIYNKMVLDSRSTSGQRSEKFVEFKDGSERLLANLLKTLFPKPKMPAVLALAGQPTTPDNVLLACQINTATAKRPYRLTKAKLLKQHPTYKGNSTYSVYCSIRAEWSFPSQAGALRSNRPPRFPFDSNTHWEVRANVKDLGGTVIFTAEFSESGQEYCDYVCSHRVSHTVQIGLLALGRRPISNCPLCADIRYSNHTGSINHTTNLDLSSRVPKNTSGTLYVIQATHVATGVSFIKVGYSVNGLNGRYGQRLVRPLSNIKTRSFKFEEITARCYESICHSVLQEHKVSLGANDLPAGFSTETYHPDCLPLLKSTLTYLRDLPMPDLITHPLAIDGIGHMTSTRTRKLRKLSDSETRRRSGIWSDYTNNN